MLSDKNINAAKPREKPYKLSDGLGLYLEVQLNGSKLMRILVWQSRIFIGCAVFWGWLLPVRQQVWLHDGVGSQTTEGTGDKEHMAEEATG